MSAAADFKTTVGSRLPSMRCDLVAPGVGNATAVTMTMKLRGGTTVKSASTVVIEETSGSDVATVRVDWAAVDVDTAGTWDLKFHATVDGLTMKLPSDSFVVVLIGADAA